MFHFHLFLVNIAVVVFEVAVGDLNDILLFSPYTFLRFLPDEYIFFKLQIRCFSFRLNPEITQGGAEASSQNWFPEGALTHKYSPQPASDSLDAFGWGHRTCLCFSTWLVVLTPTWWRDLGWWFTGWFGIAPWPLEVHRIICIFKSCSL